MSSTKEDATAATAEQLSSMSLGESAEREKSETKPNKKNGTNQTKLLCSMCGEKSNTLKKCNGCLCVWYCDKKCQNKHRKEHKKECRPIKKVLDERGGKLDLGTELDIGPLEMLPPREECPICMHVLPIHTMLQTYFPCCGKMICSGCEFQHQLKSAEQAAKREQKPPEPTCAFCREPISASDEEKLAKLRKRIEQKDPKALHNMAMHYKDGSFGLPVDQTRCIDLLRQSAGLGFPGAQYELGGFHRTGDMGLDQNEEEGIKYLEKAAEGGNIWAQDTLGAGEDENGDHVAAMRHWRFSASAGYKLSMEGLIGCFENGLLHHRDLAETLQAFYRSRSELWSEDRIQHIAYLKMTGKYEAQYEDYS